MNVKALLLLMISLIELSSCNSLNEKKESERKVVAKAGDEELELETFSSGVSASSNQKDSAYFAGRFIEKWATETLFYQEAKAKLTEEEIQIEKQVEEYRRSLVNYIYQTKVIEANLDTNINQDEIENYYEEHRANFILKDNIVKVNYLKLNAKSPVLVKTRKYLFSSNPKDREALMTLCVQNAENYFLNDSTWLFVDDLKKEIPLLKDMEDYNFSPGRVLEFNEEGYYYYLKVKDVKTKNSFSPINFERQNIRKFIINNRKTQLINQYKQLLLEKAKADKSFMIY